MHTHNPNSRESLSHALRRLLDRPEDKPISLGDVLENVGDKGFGLLLVILSLPSALPVPAAGYSVPFGIVMAALALQMILGKPQPTLPAKALSRKLPKSMTQKMLGAAGMFFGKVEFLIKPRFQWIGSRTGLRALGLVVLVMSVLMMIPIPLTNTAPAMVIFLIGVGLSEDDGLFAGFSFIAGIFAVLLYAGVIYIFITQGPEALEAIKEQVKQLARGQ